jgi:hypothetical protein
MTSKTEEALREALTIRDKIFSRLDLMRCKYLANLLNKNVEWIDFELNSYPSEEKLPYYRKPKTWVKWKDTSKAIKFDEPISFIESYYLNLPMSELHFQQGGETLLVYRQYFTTLLEFVNQQILDFIQNVIIELKFGKIESDIFEETRTLVNRELSKLCPQALKKLTETYEDLTLGKSDLKWSQIAFACREILMDFTDSIFKPEFLRDGEETPTRTQTKNKLHYTLRAKVESETNRELVESQLDYFDKLTNFVQKMAHPSGFEVTKENANRCVIYTYLLIGDVIKLLKI